MILKFANTILLRTISAVQFYSFVIGDVIFSFEKWINYFLLLQLHHLFFFHFKVCFLIKTAVKLLFFDFCKTERWKIYELLSYIHHLGIILPLVPPSLLFSLITLFVFFISPDFGRLQPMGSESEITLLVFFCLWWLQSVEAQNSPFYPNMEFWHREERLFCRSTCLSRVTLKEIYITSSGENFYTVDAWNEDSWWGKIAGVAVPNISTEVYHWGTWTYNSSLPMTK